MHIYRILVVDDDEPFRERLCKALRRRGYEVATAATVAEGFDQFRLFRPTHAVIDLRIGRDSGLSLLDKSLQGAPERAVLLTGYGSIATAIEAIRMGAYNYLIKPTSCDQIEEALFGAPLAARSEERSTAAVPSLDEVEWEHIQRVLRDCDQNITHAAAKLGVHRQALQRKLKKSPIRTR